MAASSDKELQDQLVEVANRLLRPPSPTDELLSVLNEMENCLSKIEQSPPQSTEKALNLPRKALSSKDFLSHKDEDVRVAVASCISEITRITAPNAPYGDEQMKEALKLIVQSFEGISDMSSPSYSRRVSILETVAKVRTFVVMLDLECDELIIEMFQLLLKSIRDRHPDSVFASMETIMTLVIEESEEISVDLLVPIFSSLKKGNKEYSSTSTRLSETVIRNCGSKLKPYVIQAVKSLGIFLEEYSEVMTSACFENYSDANLSAADICREDQRDEGEAAGASDKSRVSEDSEGHAAEPGTGRAEVVTEMNSVKKRNRKRVAERMNPRDGGGESGEVVSPSGRECDSPPLKKLGRPRKKSSPVPSRREVSTLTGPVTSPPESRKKRGRRKSSPAPDGSESQHDSGGDPSLPDPVSETALDSEGRVRQRSKVASSVEYGDEIVGKKVKVWWPKDRAFYEGVVDRFDSAKKKHKILYSDGDQEILNLRRERWVFLEDSPDAAAGSKSGSRGRPTGKRKSGAGSAGKVHGEAVVSNGDGGAPVVDGASEIPEMPFPRDGGVGGGGGGRRGRRKSIVPRVAEDARHGPLEEEMSTAIRKSKTNQRKK